MTKSTTTHGKKKGASAFEGAITTDVDRYNRTLPKDGQEELEKRGRGRPKARTGETQTTTIRLDSEDHRLVRQLALHKGMAMNTLILEALREYCAKEEVKLKLNS